MAKITEKGIEKTILELQRFAAALNKLRREMRNTKPGHNGYRNPSKAHSACLRSSLDLSRQLSSLRTGFKGDE